MSELPSWLSEDNQNNNTTTSGGAGGALGDVELPPTNPGGRGVVHGVAIGDTTTTNNNNNNNNAESPKRPENCNEWFVNAFRRDGRLLLITLLIIILMNVPFGQWIVYPFTIFSTWIHEVCHGMAAVLAGGKISKLEIFPDTSGLAYTIVKSSRRAFVSSAGYQGTAVVGCLLLILRRTKRGPRTGTMAMGVVMLLSVALWIRNPFGIVFISMLGLALAAAAWKFPSTWIRNLYLMLAITTTMNAITSIQNLFGSNHQVNGQASGTDAHTMAELKGGSHAMWALIWLILGLVLMLVGIVFAIPGPDEVADFACCGACQDCGLFKICNFPGLRLFSSKNKNREDGNGGTTTPPAEVPGV